MIYLLIGLIAGFYARNVYDKLKEIIDNLNEIRQRDAVGGVVTPIQKAGQTRSRPVDLSTESGMVRRMTPSEYKAESQKETDEVLKRS